ncbi:MAG: hypothetical protein WDN67_05205 [Candidatus Moraniibacteriota bacterium]
MCATTTAGSRLIFSLPFSKSFPKSFLESSTAALTIPSNPAGSLLPKDIAVRFEKSGLLDQNVIDLSILILANDYPERRGNLEERKDAILETIVRDIIPDWYTLSVWILLASGAYGSFAPTD